MKTQNTFGLKPGLMRYHFLTDTIVLIYRYFSGDTICFPIDMCVNRRVYHTPAKWRAWEPCIHHNIKIPVNVSSPTARFY